MSKRPLLSYLLLPRRMTATLLGPAGYIAAWLGGEEARTPVVVALVAWAALDLGLYQGRYLLNDLLDADVDRDHPQAAERGRLPSGGRARRWAVTVLALRVVLSLAAIALLPGGARPVAVAAVVALVVATVAYEWAREMVRRRRVPPGPVSPSLGEVGVWALIGSGYALRFGFGVALGGGGATDVLAAVAFGWMFGELAVAMVWLVESAHLRLHGGTGVLARKTHVAVLGRLHGDDPAADPAALQRPLLGPGPALLTACLLAVTSPLAVVVGAQLGGSGWPGGARLTLLLVVVTVVAPLVVARGRSGWVGLAPLALDLPAALALSTPAGRDEMTFLLLVVAGLVALFWAATIPLPEVPEGAQSGMASQQRSHARL
jgi:4-hydroxybenzoate polyprenyltransferase